MIRPGDLSAELHEWYETEMHAQQHTFRNVEGQLIDFTGVLSDAEPLGYCVESIANDVEVSAEED